MYKFGSIVNKLVDSVNIIGLSVLVLAMLLSVGDVVGRYVGFPIPGTLEITELAMVVIVFTGIAWTLRLGGHVSIILFVRHMRPRTRAVISAFCNLLTLGIWSVIAWRSFLMAISTHQQATDLLKIPILPFTLMVSLGSFLMCLVSISMLIDSIKGVRTA